MAKIKLPAMTGTSGIQFSVKEISANYVVLFFYPKDSTPGCTVEANEFSKLYPQFKKQETEVFGVSRDSLKSHENFKTKQNLKLELLSDPEENACKAFDVIKEKNMYGKKYLGIERSTFVLDKKGQLIKEWRKVKPEGHALEVLQFIKDLKN